jgi:hypothetical protein
MVRHLGLVDIWIWYRRKMLDTYGAYIRRNRDAISFVCGLSCKFNVKRVKVWVALALNNFSTV